MISNNRLRESLMTGTVVMHASGSSCSALPLLFCVCVCVCFYVLHLSSPSPFPKALRLSSEARTMARPEYRSYQDLSYALGPPSLPHTHVHSSVPLLGRSRRFDFDVLFSFFHFSYPSFALWVRACICIYTFLFFKKARYEAFSGMRCP